MAEKLRLGLLGAGRIGKLHGRNIANRIENATLAAIADVYVAAAQALADELGVAQVYNDPMHVINDPEIDAVIICTSTNTHAELIEAAAKAGKHIFCEKPIDHDLARIDQVLEVVKEAGINLQVGFNRRFDPGFARAQRAVAEGQVGDVQIMRITSRDPAPPPIEYVKVSGGLFMDMMIHDFDMSRFLVGREVEEIYAVGAVLIDPAIGEVGDVDTAVVTIRFENGVIGTIDCSRQAVYGYDQRIEVFGSKGMVAVGNNTPDQAVVTTIDGALAAKPVYFFLERYEQAYIAEMTAFAQAILDGTETPVTGWDGRMPVVMAAAALKSLKEGRPVRLDEIRA